MLTAYLLTLIIGGGLVANAIFDNNIGVFNSNPNENKMLEDIHKLKNLLDSLIHQEQKIVYEKDDRIVHNYAHFTPPPPLSESKLSKVVRNGEGVRFRFLYNEPLYLRPIFDPSWKSTFYRGWLDIPVKNMEAHHKIFAFSIGGSANYDIVGSLGYSPKSPPIAPLDNHRNINLLIFCFNVRNVKTFEDQVALIGEPKQAGAQIVSIVQDDLLPPGVNKKDFLFQLSTSGGYEIDFIRNNVIRYEYLMQIIKENTVGAFDPLENEYKSQEKLLIENAALKKELSYFIPLKDEIIRQKTCDSVLGSQTESDNLQSIIPGGEKIPFSYNYINPVYKRPLYDPSWNANYKRMWCYIPKQVEYNLHRLLVVPKNKENEKDFFGTLGFHEKFQPIKPEQCGLMVYNFNVSDVKLYNNQLILVGTPSRAGAQIVTISRSNLKAYGEYRVRLVTPDNSEVDCNILIP